MEEEVTTRLLEEVKRDFAEIDEKLSKMTSEEKEQMVANAFAGEGVTSLTEYVQKKIRNLDEKLSTKN